MARFSAVRRLFSRLRGPACRSLLRDRRGVTAIEFALVAPLVIFAIVEICQLSLYVIYAAVIESATGTASRQIKVGGIDGSVANAAAFRTSVLCPNLLIGSCANVVTNIQTATLGAYSGGYRAFVKSDLSDLVPVDMDNSKTSYCVGAQGAYLYVQAFYAVPVFSPIWKATTKTTYQGRQAAYVRAAAAFRNEPYTGSSPKSDPGC